MEFKNIEDSEDIQGMKDLVGETINLRPLNKLQRLKKELVILKSKDKKTMKKNRGPKILRNLMKKKKKKLNYVVVQYLTINYEMQFKLCKVISGNLVVVENKVHKLDPDKIWRLGKDSCYILREIDRHPVSNEDYGDVRARGDDTDADVPLIKAVLGAIQKQGSSAETNKNTMVIIGVIAAIVIGAILFMK